MVNGGVESLPDPPDPPDIRRSVALYRFQWIGLPFLLAIPLLALFGVFGEHRETVTAESGAVALSVRYPATFRYGMLNAIDVDIRNRGSIIIDTLTISLDTTYVTGFSTVTAVPPFTGSYEIDVMHLMAGESRRVRIELQAERYWSHSGRLTAASRVDTVRVPLTTMVYP